MKNQTEKAVLKEEIKTISHTNKINEQKYIDIVNKRFELWHQSLQTCVRLFKTTTSYKKIQLIETSKIKREKGVSQEDISLIYQEINEVFTEAMQELLNQYPNLTQEDLYYCILNYLQLSNDTIKKCMRVESQYALNQRKYRIRKQLSNQTFSVIFDLKTIKIVLQKKVLSLSHFVISKTQHPDYQDRLSFILLFHVIVPHTQTS